MKQIKTPALSNPPQIFSVGPDKICILFEKSTGNTLRVCTAGIKSIDYVPNNKITKISYEDVGYNSTKKDFQIDNISKKEHNEFCRLMQAYMYDDAFVEKL